MINTKQYYNKKYFDWQKQIGQIGGQINLTKFDKYIGANDIVLDFGCGGGYLLRNLRCAKKIGVEINESAREECRKNGLRGIYGSLGKIGDNSVDVVISNHALEHSENPLDILVKLHRVLKPERKIILVLPYDDYRNAKNYDPEDVNNHLYTWNSQLIGNCLKAAGFKNIDTKVYVHAWPKNYVLYYSTLPRKIFDVVCYFTSIKNKRRQIIAVAQK